MPQPNIIVSFNGKLREDQKAAFEALSSHDTGILSATTAFGKTVIGTALIVVIVSPYVAVKRVRWVEAALQQCNQRNVKATVIIRTPESFPSSSRKAAEMAIGMLRELQVEVVCREGIHQKYAIMDENVVWYGSINLLNFSTSQESIMRLHSSSIARALMNTEEGENS